MSGRILQMATSATESDLEQAMLSSWTQTCRLRYRAARIYQMFMPHCKCYIGGIETAQHVIRNAPMAVDGFLMKHKRPELAVEAIILEERFIHLFNEEDIKIARQTLRKCQAGKN